MFKIHNIKYRIDHFTSLTVLTLTNLIVQKSNRITNERRYRFPQRKLYLWDSNWSSRLLNYGKPLCKSGHSL